jgi:hypothetical protein
MKPTDKKRLFRYIIVNLTISLAIVLVLWWTGGFIEGIWFYVQVILITPSFIILSLIGGINYAMHFAREITFRVVSFIFYSAVIALIQMFIYKRRKKEEDEGKVENK